MIRLGAKASCWFLFGEEASKWAEAGRLRRLSCPKSGMIDNGLARNGQIPNMF